MLISHTLDRNVTKLYDFCVIGVCIVSVIRIDVLLSKARLDEFSEDSSLITQYSSLSVSLLPVTPFPIPPSF